MSRKVQTFLVDDLDGSAAETTIRFSLDGADYEIDLNDAHRSRLEQALSQYVSAGRRVAGSARRRRDRGSAEPSSSEVRQWARSQGIDIKDRGRLPSDITARFKAATHSR
ncbi:MAG TPA: Lsr2 family protein [Streptosporangiaceae bacterium]|nr:Lsr2 family protein [Streptosporangiaceae bacterium]